MIPNLIPSYPKVNEAAKDLMTAALGVGILRLAGMKLEVGYLPIKTLAFGAFTTAAGAALGREGLIQLTDSGFDRKSGRNDMNKSLVVLAILAISAAATLSVAQYTRVGNYLPVFTQINRNQALALGGFAITSMVGMRFFGFVDQTSKKPPRKPETPVYSVESGALESKSIEDMLQLSDALKAVQVKFGRRQDAEAYNARIDTLLSESAERSGELVKVRLD